LAVDVLDRVEAALGPQPDRHGTDWTESQDAWWIEWTWVQYDRGMVQYAAAQVDAMSVTVSKLAQGAEQCDLPLIRVGHWSISQMMSLRRDRYVVSADGVDGALAILAPIKELGDPDHLARTEYSAGWAYLLHGDLDGAEEHLQAGLMLAKRTGNLVDLTWLLTWLSVLHRKRGEAEATRAYAVRGLQAATDAQLLENAGLVRGNLAWLAWREGDLAEAEKQGQAALELWQKSPFVYAFHWTARFPLLAVALIRELIPEAVDHTRAMLDPLQQRLPEPLEAALQAADEGSLETAHQRLEHAIQVAQETGYL
jgi:hypothetical protein